MMHLPFHPNTAKAVRLSVGLWMAVLGIAAIQLPVKGAPTGNEMVEKMVVAYDGASKHQFLSASGLYTEGWDTLAQARFWQKIIGLTHDSMLVNVAKERRILECVPSTEWHCQTETEKDAYKQNLCVSRNLPEGTELYVTGGKRFFFEYSKVMPIISQSIGIFRENGTDPWYAQAILLIESPGKTHATSYVGARGPFQLMPAVARKYGLVVNKYRDDRTNLDKSAMAAAALINTVCLPYARQILDAHQITYQETDIWFRLFVLHIYHAGAGNVRAVVDEINPSEGGMPLIRKMWQTQSRGFKNESQNYSQIALASMLLFDKMINAEKDSVFLVSGDRLFKKFRDHSARPLDTLNYLTDCMGAYESDFIEGAIPFQYFTTQTAAVRKEMDKYSGRSGNSGQSQLTADAAESARLHQLGKQLLYKRKVNEAIEVFQLGIKTYPISPATYDSLSYAYKLLGKTTLAAEYDRKSKEVRDNPQRFLNNSGL